MELLQVHNLRDWKTQLPYARELKEQGKTRYVGVTHYLDRGLDEMERILRSGSRSILARFIIPLTPRRRRKPYCPWPVTRAWRC